MNTGRVELLFLVPGIGETLRIDGSAALIRDENWLTLLSAQGKCPAVAVAVDVDQCFLQCAKALIQSKLLESHEPPNQQSLPCAAEMLSDHAKMPEFDSAELQMLLDVSTRINCTKLEFCPLLEYRIKICRGSSPPNSIIAEDMLKQLLSGHAYVLCLPCRRGVLRPCRFQLSQVERI